MKKILLNLVLLAGISSVSTFAAEKAPTVGDNDCYKGAAPGLILLPDDCTPVQSPCSFDPRPCKEEAVKRQMVNFVTLGGTLEGVSKSFTSFKAGESLKFVYKKEHELSSASVTLLGCSKNHVWTARAPLTYGKYTGELYSVSKSKKNLLDCFNFTINYTNDLVVISK